MFNFITKFFKKKPIEDRKFAGSVQEALENFKDDIVSLGEYQTAVHICEFITILNELESYGERPAEWFEANLAVGLELLQMDIEDIAPSPKALDAWVKN